MAEQQKVAIDKKGNFLEDPSINTESMRLTYTPSDIDSPPEKWSHNWGRGQRRISKCRCDALALLRPSVTKTLL